MFNLKTYEKLETEIKKKISLIQKYPYMYQSANGEIDYRRFVVQKYIVFYKIEYQNIIILRIVPARVNFNQNLIYK